MFTAIKRWLHRLFGKNEEQTVQPVKTKKKLSRADKKQIEAAIARANRTDKKEKSAQDSIPYERMWADGICRVADGHYTKTIQFQDINYQLSQNEDKTAIFEGWCDFLNYFDSSIRFELSFLNLAASEETFARAISIPLQGDDFDSIRTEYTEMLQNQLARGNNGLIKTKYLTFGIDADSIKAAKPRLERIETDILNNFKRLGVAAKRWTERRGLPSFTVSSTWTNRFRSVSIGAGWRPAACPPRILSHRPFRVPHRQASSVWVRNTGCFFFADFSAGAE